MFSFESQMTMARGKKKKAKPDHVIDLTVFPVEVNVWTRRRALDRYADRYADSVIDDGARFSSAFFLRLEEKGDHLTYHIYFDDRNPVISHVWHECLHAAIRILGDLGIRVSQDTEECVCYVQGYLAERVTSYFEAQP